MDKRGGEYSDITAFSFMRQASPSSPSPAATEGDTDTPDQCFLGFTYQSNKLSQSNQGKTLQGAEEITESLPPSSPSCHASPLLAFFEENGKLSSEMGSVGAQSPEPEPESEPESKSDRVYPASVQLARGTPLISSDGITWKDYELVRTAKALVEKCLSGRSQELLSRTPAPSSHCDIPFDTTFFNNCGRPNIIVVIVEEKGFSVSEHKLWRGSPIWEERLKHAPPVTGLRYVELDDASADWFDFFGILSGDKHLDPGLLLMQNPALAEDTTLLEFGRIFRIALKHDFEAIKDECNSVLWKIMAHTPSQWSRMSSLTPLQVFRFLEIAFEHDLEYYQTVLQFCLGTMLQCKEMRPLLLNYTAQIEAHWPDIFDDLAWSMVLVMHGLPQFTQVLTQQAMEGCCSRVWLHTVDVWDEILKDKLPGGPMACFDQLAKWSKPEESEICDKCQSELVLHIESHLDMIWADLPYIF
ncbi:hypothetical protein M422DRAFT_248259 [Sphaerobolus stellatus SS14]|uniref:Uncharacterized protein n=1 Tax=Sphaerobolus stellatus (strain SS14) TaxID=990650 RepID=A0A0C9VWE9_SPHS4|nr:hypothetical protein M422DRAFT_248259 [Sphaerobolus stellatus SS14]